MMKQPALSLTLLVMLLAASNSPVMAQTLTQRLMAESVEKLAAEAREKGNAVQGAILFTQENLSCTKCHAPGDTQPVGPNLNGLGSEATDVHLVESLLEPSKSIKKGFETVSVVTTSGKTLTGRMIDEKPDQVVLRLSTDELPRVTLPRDEIEQIAPSTVSAMPDNLVDQLANRQQFLDLIRYLMEIAAADPPPVFHAHSMGGQTIKPGLWGLVLLQEYNCTACHEGDVLRTPLTAKLPPNLSRSAGNIDPHFLRRFIADPLSTHPGTTMPDVMSGLKEEERLEAAEELTHYLASLGEQPFSRQELEPAAAERGRELFHTVGCVACHSPRDDNQEDVLAESSVPLGSIHLKYNLDGLVRFLENPLEFRPSGRMPKMHLTHWESVDVASYLLAVPQEDGASPPFKIDRELRAQGKIRFDQLGCAQCHQIDVADSNPMAEPMPQVLAQPTSLPLSEVRVEHGCLSDAQGKWPTFSLTKSQRQAIAAALSRETRDLSGADQIGMTLTAFRCVNCHQRDDLGGVSDERDKYFQTTNPNLGPQGRIPPTLTGVGAKLDPAWLRQVLVGEQAIRPYVLTRMPQYGIENVEHLVDLFPQTDPLPAVEFAKFQDKKLMREAGAEMVGTGGLNCIVCHTFQLQEAANMPAVDLTVMAQRLQKDWFYHYMRNPQSLSPNTIMPSFWPGGKGMRHDILDGNRDQQIEALWQYLLDGRQARTPRGLIVEPLELLATEEAVMLRRSYPGVGKRGIGVGYPHQVNLVFDAEQMRLAMIWQGKFADPAGVWRSQGHGNVRPLGDKLMRFAAGPDLDDTQDPWIVDEDRPPRHQFKGYSLDEQMRPRFRYQFGEIDVEDYAVDKVDPQTSQPFILRTVALKAEAPYDELSFRAATGKSIVRGDDGVYVVEDRLQIQIDEAHTAAIVDGEEGKELRIELPITDGSTRLTLEYRW